MAIAYTRTFNSGTTLSKYPVPGNPFGRGVQSLYEIIDITTIAVATNTADVGYLPKGAICIGGYFSAVDLDTGTEALDMDLGITANGVDSADPDFFMNGGLFSGDLPIATDLIITNAANYRPIVGPFPVFQLGAKTLVQLITNTAANATGTGKCVTRIDYLMPGVRTS